MAKVIYRWSSRSKPDVCDLQEYIMKNEMLCYHCGTLIPSKSEAVLLLTDRGERYILHKSCADRSCKRMKEEQS